MQRLARTKGQIETDIKEFPILAVNTLDRLGYKVSRASKQLDQILATERVEEQYGRDWWRSEYRVVLRWSAQGPRTVAIELEMSEHKGGGSVQDCQRRGEQIVSCLRNDAMRAKSIAATKPKSTAHGAACWAGENDLRRAGYVLGKPDPARLILGRTQDDKYICVPEMVTHAHALVCGRTGVGKSRGFFIPQLVERLGTSMIVTEATPGYEAGELYKLTSGWRKMAGHDVYCFNPADMSSHRINPIDRVRRAPNERKSELAERLADLLITNAEPTESRYDQTWNRSEKLLLIPLILHAAASDPEQGHFGALRWLLLTGPDQLAQVLRHSPSSVAQREFEGWRELSGKTDFRYGVFSGLITKLNPWLTDQMVTLTATTDFQIDDFRDRLFTFYLAVPSRSRDGKLIGSLMLNFLLSEILEIRPSMKYPMTMLLDEFTNFGRIAGIGDTLSLIRKNEIGLVLGFQNYFQLEQVYGRREAQIIIDMPATQVYFKQKNYQEAKALSEALGRTTVEEVTVTDAGRVQEFLQGRALATPDELINLNGEVIVFGSNIPPMKMRITPPAAYDHSLQYPPPERPEHLSSESIQRCMTGVVQHPQVTNNEGQPNQDLRQPKKRRRKPKQKINRTDTQQQGRAQVWIRTPPDQPQAQKQAPTQSPEVDDIWTL